MNKNKSQKIYKVIMLVVLTAIITFLVTTITMYNKFSKAYEDGNISIKNNLKNMDMLIGKINAINKMIKNKYIGNINEEDMLEYAIKGYVAGLGDPYTQYFTKEEMREFMEETNSEYVGVGVYLSVDKKANQIVCMGVIKGSPAEKVGIKIGDKFLKVNDKEFNGDELKLLVKELKGYEGTKAKVQILRDDKKIDLEIERRKINIEHVNSKKIDNNIGYIQIDEFDKGVKDSFEEQYDNLKSEGINKLIIDLRNNGGGLVDEALDIVDLFVEKNKTILITNSKDKKDIETKSVKSKKIKDIPVVILVNELTASASEILTGSLKEIYENVTIVGKKSYGKGVIQMLKPMIDGSGIKVTCEEYFTPKHNKINEVGIEPDVEVDLSKDEKGNYEIGFDKDAQILKAIEILRTK